MKLIYILLIIYVVAIEKTEMASIFTTTPSTTRKLPTHFPKDKDESSRSSSDPIQDDTSTDKSVTPAMEHYLHQLVNKLLPINCITSLIFSIVGAASNVVTIIILRKLKMVPAISTILMSIAFCELIVHILDFPCVVYELPYPLDKKSNYNYTQAIYILIHENITLTVHTISVWLSCVVVAWRYYASRNARSSNHQSVKFALRILGAVCILVVTICIPQYSLNSISEELTEFNGTKYQISLSKPIKEWSHPVKYYFCLLSCCTSLIPCLWMSCYSIALKRQLRIARDRRLKLVGLKSVEDISKCIEILSNYSDQDSSQRPRLRDNKDAVLANKIDAIIYCSNRHNDMNLRETRFLSPCPSTSQSDAGYTVRTSTSPETKTSFKKNNNEILQQHYEVSSKATGSKCADENESGNNCYGSGAKGSADRTSNQKQVAVDDPTQQKSLPTCHLLVKRRDEETIFTTAVQPDVEISIDFDDKEAHDADDSLNDYNNCHNDDNNNNYYLSAKTSWAPNHRLEQRPASALSNLQPYSWNSNSKIQDAGSSSFVQLEEINRIDTQSKLLRCDDHIANCPQNFLGKTLRNSVSTSELVVNERLKFHKNKDKFGKPVGSCAMSPDGKPVPIISLEAARRHINLNEFADKLTTAAMIIFVICEFPPGIMATLSIDLDENFYYYVLQPSRVLTHLIYIIGGTVNLALNCAMSSNFRESLYELRQGLFNRFNL